MTLANLAADGATAIQSATLSPAYDVCSSRFGSGLTYSGASAERCRKLLQQIGVTNACRRLKDAGDELVKGLVFQLERNLNLVGSKDARPGVTGTMFWFL